MSDSKHPIYAYISTQAAYDPVKTLYVCAPEKDAVSVEALERFAVASGWQAVAEEERAILVMPVAAKGWQAESANLFMEIYAQNRNAFQTRSGKSILGSNGVLWSWETMLYLAGYEEGAQFAGNALVKCPNMFGATALINGVPSDYCPGDEASNHWLVPHVSEDYEKKNREIPVCLWMFHQNMDAVRPAVTYFSQSAGIDPNQSQREALGDLDARVWKSGDNPAQQIRVFEGNFGREPFLAQYIVKQLFDHTIRWKNSPDGTLAVMDSREEFYRNPRFIRHTVREGENDYDFFVHLPAGMTAKDAAGLPLVFTVHGRGEPAWMFTTKNGWDLLADETREFVLISPDSPGNIWTMERDTEVFEKMIQVMAEQYHIDTTRVYLTGFSNGGVITREVSVLHPELFAAISPWNAPGPDSITLYRVTGIPPMEFGPEFAKALADFQESGYELPCFYVYGDDDNKAPHHINMTLEVFLAANGCGSVPDMVYDAHNCYTAEAGYTEGARFRTVAYKGRGGVERVCALTMKNMPHGAVNDECRAVWNFLKRFRRQPGAKTVDAE